MSNLTTIVNNIITKTNSNTTNKANTTYVDTEVAKRNLPIAKSSLLKGTFSLSNTVIEAGFGTKLYTGNGTTQSIDAGVDLASQWGDTVNETYGGLVWGKTRGTAGNHNLFDTIRDSGVIYTNNVNAEANSGSSTNIIDYTSTGFTFNGGYDLNLSGSTYASWIFQTTHRISGTTNHGKNYTCHYNPTTGFTIVKYEGSGIAGHEIPHHLGRDVSMVTIKNLSTTSDWFTPLFNINNYVYMNSTNAGGGEHTHTSSDSAITLTNTGYDASGNSYILYGWANSYYDDAGVLNGNYEIGIYQGTGASGNKITTRGKPAWVMIKRLDDVNGNWLIYDNQRRAYLDARIVANTSATEYYNYDVPPSYNCTFENKSFTVNNGAEINASGGQYLYMCVYDNDNASGKSKYPKASETSNISVTNGVVAYSDGVGSNGANSSIENLGSTTFTGITWDI